MKKFLSWLKDFLFKDDISINRTFALVYAFFGAGCAMCDKWGGVIAMFLLLLINSIEYHALVTKPVAQTHVIVIRPDTDEDEEEENA